MKTCIINTLFVIESLTIVNLLNKVQFPFVKVFPPQMLSSSSEGAIVQAVPIAFAPVVKSHPPYLLGRTIVLQYKFNTLENKHLCETFHNLSGCSLTNTFLIVWFVLS